MNVAPCVCPWSDSTTISYGRAAYAARAFDAAELLVELAQRLEGVRTLEAGVVRDLVVTRERRVDRRPPSHHVGEDAVHDQVAHDDAHCGAHERVDAAAVPARPNVAPPLARRGRPLEDHLPAEEDEHARHVEAVREERLVARVRTALGLDPADRQDHLVGAAGEQVPTARAAADEQSDTARMPPLELGAVAAARSTA